MVGSFMISLLYLERRNVPLVICEHCKKPITDAGLGMVSYGPEVGEGEYQEFAMLHKGTCDEAYKGGNSDVSGWCELSHFLFRLCANTGMDGKALKEASRDLEMLSRF